MNSENNISKEEADKIMAAPGEIRGLAIKANWDYLRKVKGPEVVLIIEEEFIRLGYPFPYKGIKILSFYAAGYDALLLLMLERFFHVQEDGFVEMGADGVKSSILMKVVIKYFASVEKAVIQAVKIWPRYYILLES